MTHRLFFRLITNFVSSNRDAIYLYGEHLKHDSQPQIVTYTPRP